MVDVAYKPSQPIKKTDFPFYPKYDFPPYPDIGVKYAGHSKSLSQGGGYTLNPQEPFNHFFNISSAAEDVTLIENKRLYITGIYVAWSSNLLAATQGFMVLEIDCDGQWGDTSFVNQQIISIPFANSEANKDERGQTFISFHTPIPVKLGTRTIRFLTATSYSLVDFAGFCTGFYDKEI